MALAPLAPGDRGFSGFTRESFAFFAGLAADNTRAWFRAHQDVYRSHVDRPWRDLVEAVAPPLRTLLPELDCEVKAGHVLSRIAARWPRPDAAYRTDLTALFHPAGGGEWVRQPRLFVSLAADGIRSGLEAPPRTAAWSALAEALRAGEPPAGAAPGLRAWVGRQPLEPGGAEAARRGATLRLSREWPADVAVARGTELAAEVLAALGEAVPWYLYAAQAAGPAGGEGLPPEEGREAVQPLAEAGRPEPPEPPRAGGEAAEAFDGAGAAALAGLPRSLRAAVQARAEAEGVPAGVFVVYALARAVEGRPQGTR